MQTHCTALHQQGLKITPMWHSDTRCEVPVSKSSQFKICTSLREAGCSPKTSVLTAGTEMKFSLADEQGGDHMTKISALERKNEQKQ